MATQQEVSPILYDFYGKQYDYNELAKAADAGLNEYLGTLSRGTKDALQFRDAYANMMSGIKDGTITFSDGHFNDTQGRYSNAEKLALDYYGLIANYIYGKMGQSGEYQAPVDTSKIAWDDSSLKTALIKEIFNSDNPNLQDFLELDDEKDGVRAITNRSARLASALQNISNNWDNTFTGYTDADKTKYLQLLSDAVKAILDGAINAGDYLALDRAVNGVDFRTMLAGGTPTTTASSTASTQAAPTYKLKSTSLVDLNYSSDDLNHLTAVMSKVKSTKGLVNILRNSFYNRNYRFGSDARVYSILKNPNISSKAGVTATLNALNARGYLKVADPANPNILYIPGTRTRRGTAWVWDKSNNKVAELKIDDIPYLKAKFTQSAKHGGVLYAAAGATTPSWYSGISDYDKNKYGYEWGSTAYGMDKDGNFTNAFGTTGAGYNLNRYTTDSNYRDFGTTGKLNALAIENSANYKALTDKILSDYDAWNNATDKSTFNEKNNLFLRYSKWYDSLQQNAANRFWNNDKLNTNWSANGKDYYGNTTAATSNIRDRILRLRNDLMISLAHNNFKAAGNRYYYKDSDGKVHYVDPEVAKSGKYKVSDKGTTSTEGFTDWTDYALTGLNDLNPANPETGSKVDTTLENKPQDKLNWYDKWGKKVANNLAPLAASAGLLGLSIHNNNKTADTLKKGDRVAYLNPWEYHTPTTGRFDELQNSEKDAAKVENMAANMLDTDLALNFARALEANITGRKYREEGRTKDNAEVERTKEIGQQYAAQGIQNRNNIANLNVTATAQWRTRQAEYDALKRQANYQGVYNFAANDLIAPMKEELAYKRGLERQEEATKKYNDASYDIAPMTRELLYRKQQLTSYYSRKQLELYNKYLPSFLKLYNDNANDINYDIQSSTEYLNYLKELNALQDLALKDEFEMSNFYDSLNRAAYNTIYNNLHSGNYTSEPFKMTYSDDIKRQNWYKILSGVQSHKRGGKIRPHIQKILNNRRA